MAKQTKTVGKTTNKKKGGTTMTIADALTQLMLDYNSYQEYRKNNEQTYIFASKQQIADFAKQLKPEELLTLTKAYMYQRQMQTNLSKYLYNERILNNIYGKEDKNIMELTDEEREYINKRRARQAEKASQRKEMK